MKQEKRIKNKPSPEDIDLANATVDLFWNDRTKGIPELRGFVAEAIAEVRAKSWEAGFEAGESSIKVDWELVFENWLDLDVNGPLDAVKKIIDKYEAKSMDNQKGSR